MAWQECSCGHRRSHHPWLGYGPYGTTSGYGGCGLCQVCLKPFSEHVFVGHQFTRCACTEYREAA